MRIINKTVTILLTSAILCSLLSGCSKSNIPLSQPSTSKSEASSTANPSALPAAAASKPENDKAINSKASESWIGAYKFSEFAPPDENMFYAISIYKDNESYYAKINIDGFQTIKRMLTKVSGDKDSIKLTFVKYLPDNAMEPYKVGDILLTLEKRNSEVYTTWGKIEPLLKENAKPGVYFRFDPGI
ncbi:MAG TPA: DUF5991 domain-containing protein [Clostridia bacterium]